jgi:hypothetical protein
MATGQEAPARMGEGARCGCATRVDFRVLDGLALPVFLLGPDRKVTAGNRAASEAFGPVWEKGLPAAQGADVLQAGERESVRNLQPGQSTRVEMGRGEPRHQFVVSRLPSPVDGVAFVMTVYLTGARRADDEAVRRMKHRFNNYLAPLAGKAEIILFALKKGNYEKVEKAAKDILAHAEDTRALDALFDLEPAQESTSIRDYVT